MKYLLCYAIGIICILSCSDNQRSNNAETNIIEQQESNDKKYFKYPDIIDSLGLHKLYDNTKWQLYLLKALDTPKYFNEYAYTESEIQGYIFDSLVSYSNIELRLDSLSIDSTEGVIKMYFEFFLNDTLALNPVNFDNYLGGYEGMEYKFNNDSDTTWLCYISKYAYFSITKECFFWTKNSTRHTNKDTITNRYINPLQPDVIEYLNKHKHEIHPWLYNEGVKRGVIKE